MNTGRIPREVTGFFQARGGRSLILKGAPGTGKTTMALEILDSFKDRAKVCYVSSRIDEQALKDHIPWVDFEVLLSRGQDEGSRYRAREGISRRELDRLETRVEEGDEYLEADIDPEGGGVRVEGNTWSFDLGALLPEVDMLYQILEGAMPGNAIAAIDSIDSLGEKYGISPRRLLLMMQKDLVERSGIKVIFVLESYERNPLEFLGDGVVTLGMDSIGGRRLRTLTMDKLRGQEIRVPLIPFSLAGGRFTAFDHVHIPGDAGVDMSGILEKIARPGHYTMIEMDRSVPHDIVQALVKSVIMGQGENLNIYTTPSVRLLGSSPSRFLEKATAGHPAAVKVIGTPGMTHRSMVLPDMKVMDGDSIISDFDLDAISAMFDSPGELMFIADINQMLNAYGPDAAAEMERHISALVGAGGAFLGFYWPHEYAGNSMYSGLAHTLLRMETLAGQTMVLGEKPFTPVHVLSPVDDDGKMLRPVPLL